MNNPKKKHDGRSIRAFTLIEVLIASAVMVILVGIVASIVSSVMNAWNRSSGKLVANAEARLALNLIAQDLETAVLQNNGQQWLRVESATLLGSPPYSSAQSDSVILKLFSPALDQQDGDGICAIAYQLQYKRSYAGGSSTYALYRMIEDPDTTLEFYLSSRFDNPATSNQGNLSKKSASSNAGTHTVWSDNPAGGIIDDANYLAGNIVSFKILLYDSSSVPDPVNADPASNAINTGYYAFGGVSSAGNRESTNQLLYADIILTVITDQGMDLLNNISASSSAADVVTQHGETLIRRVYFQANPI